MKASTSFIRAIYVAVLRQMETVWMGKYFRLFANKNSQVVGQILSQEFNLLFMVFVNVA
jgi:hypothetical protein